MASFSRLRGHSAAAGVTCTSNCSPCHISSIGLDTYVRVASSRISFGGCTSTLPAQPFTISQLSSHTSPVVLSLAPLHTDSSDVYTSGHELTTCVYARSGMYPVGFVFLQHLSGFRITAGHHVLFFRYATFACVAPESHGQLQGLWMLASAPQHVDECSI